MHIRMIDKDKVMAALEKLSKDERQYWAGSRAELKEQLGLQELAEDALALLKEQEETIYALQVELAATKESLEAVDILQKLGDEHGGEKVYEDGI